MATVFIPAKGGSTRIKEKNMVLVGGKPLIWWTLEACRRWPIVDQVYVATENQDIARFASTNGAVIYELENTDITDQRTASQLWQKFCKSRDGDQIIMYITNPFRRIWELNDAWELYRTGQFDIVISARKECHLIYNHDCSLSISKEERMTRLTQSVLPKYVADGSFYISNAEYVANCKSFEDGKVSLYPVSRISGIEIDYPEDLELVRIIANSIDWWSNKFQFRP